MSHAFDAPHDLLRESIERWDHHAARLALKSGANPNAASAQAPSPLWLVCSSLSALGAPDKKEALAILRSLLKFGADPRQTHRGESALHRLAREGEAEGVKIIGSFCPALIDSADSLGRTPLIVACESGEEPSALALIELGADPQARDRLGRDALSCAPSSGLDTLSFPALKTALSPADPFEARVIQSPQEAQPSQRQRASGSLEDLSPRARYTLFI